MIRKLQNISDAGAQKMVYKEILVRELIANILDNYSDDLTAMNIKVIEEIELKDSFKSYGAFVNVILENLIENAIQFATPQDPFIKTKASSNGKSVVLQVEDNEQGIPEEYHSRIFDINCAPVFHQREMGWGYTSLKKLSKNWKELFDLKPTYIKELVLLLCCPYRLKAKWSLKSRRTLT